MIPQLKAVMPLERAQMRLRIVISGKEARKLREKVVKLASKVEAEDWTGGELNLVSDHSSCRYYVRCYTFLKK